MQTIFLFLTILFSTTLVNALPAAVGSDVNNLGQTALEISRSAHDKVDAVIEALVNPESCVYNPDFQCTRENLTHVYQTKTWTTPGNYTWTVPAGVTQIYAAVVSGQGGGGAGGGFNNGHGNGNGSRGQDGGNSSVDSIVVSGGAGGNGGSGRRYGTGNRGGTGHQNAKNDYLTVNAHQLINIIVGAGGRGASTYFNLGGAGGTSNGEGGAGASGSSSTTKAQPGNGGTHGRVTIKY